MKLRFVRHGATAANVLGVRCGGDLDLPLVEDGRAQVQRTARRIAALDPPVRLIVTSGLRRTRETAEIIAHALGRPQIVIEPDLAERSLGDWNLLTLEQTQAWLDRGLTPPGGETRAVFADRVARAVRRLLASCLDGLLLVGSKGVARVLGEMCGFQGALQIANAELTEFEFAARPRAEAAEVAL